MRKILLWAAIIALNLICAKDIRAQSGYISTIAGNGVAGFSGDGGPATAGEIHHNSCIWIDSSGNLYIADQQNNRVRKVTPYGIITTVAGDGAAGYSGDGGPATAAKLNYTQGVAADNTGNIYIADQHNNRVRKVSATGIITTFAGNGSGSFSGDGGPASAATVNQPAAVAVDNAGNVYICDQNNARIRKVDNAGIITTIAGGGSSLGDGGPATVARLNWPCNLAIDNLGNVFIADFQANRIRKVSPTGIISTIAGTGTAGYTGDGGPATAAEICNHWGGVYPDSHGNIIIADCYNNCVRKIDNTGIITTIIGNGTAGYTGDGGLASAALVYEPVSAFVTSAGDLYVSDCLNSAIRKVSYTPTYTSDSFTIYLTKNCFGPQITIYPDHYSSALAVKTFFGDGNINVTSILSTGFPSISHTYANNGTYTIKQVLYNGAVALDSFSYNYTQTLCNSFAINLFYDQNGNCIKDAGEKAVTDPILVAVDSNGIPIDTISVTSGLYYTAYGSAGDVYTFRFLSAPAGFVPSCASIEIKDTLSLSLHTPKYFGFICSSSSYFDLTVSAPYHWINTTDQRIHGYVTNNTCTPVNATLTLTVNPKFTNIVQIYPTPTSVVDNIVTWNLSDLWNGAGQFEFQLLPYTLSIMTIGDTLHTSVAVTPYVGDNDTFNNYMIIVDTIRAGYDPNEMQVTPSCIESSASPIQLQYTINFENTGNDTAHNIYVMDTLPDNVDISTMRLQMVSEEMYISKFTDASNQNIIKFDFPNINLLDSTHHGQCDGVVVFNIKTIPGLANGTNIYNRAGIYFDDNNVVMTNQVDNIVGGCNPEIVRNSQPSTNTVTIFPNPANTELTIQMSPNAYASFTVTNSIGQEMIARPLSTAQTNVNVATLPPGLYYITFRGDNGTSVQKFVKM